MKALKKVRDFLQIVLGALWLFFPSLIFLVLITFILATMTIGRDLVQMGIEDVFRFLLMPISFSVWAYISWYSSRLVAYEKSRVKAGVITFTWFPRGLSYLCYTIGITIMLLMPDLNLTNLTIGVIIGADILLFVVFILIRNRLTILAPMVNSWFSWPIFISVLFITMWIIFNFKQNDPVFLIYSLAGVLFVHQIFSLLHIIVRRSKGKTYNTPVWVNSFFTLFQKPITYFRIKKSELSYFITFNLVAVFVFMTYLGCIFSIDISRSFSGFNIVFLGFAVMLGIGNLLSFVSVRYRLNLHIIVIAAAAISGQAGEDPYNIRSFKKSSESEPFNERQGLSQYTEGWLKEKLAQSDSSDTVRMTFVLSDGGASRSGLWATSVFTYLTSETNGKFRDNLFCLAGASGGGVGNSVYFSWLDTQLKNERAELGWMNNQMRFDFLAPTVGRLLSTDYFRHVFPLNRLPMSDRAGILEESMENTGTGLMDKPMSSLVTCKKKIGYKLPLLYINTTRMQDAMPAVVSNINLKEHSERLDVLTLLDSMPMNEMHDINLSTAAVLGSRFPYVSPAGAIKNHYFVDGGYFDNSGAGIAHETMLFIDQNKEKLRLEKRIIEFLVIHIQNNSLGSDSLKSVHPLVNDLAAPVKTLAGSYSQQTNLNDGRLYQYLYNRQGGNSGLTYEEWLPSAASAVYKINLYDAEVCNNSKLPMSWAISATKADTMSIQCLQGNTRLRSLVKKLKD